MYNFTREFLEYLADHLQVGEKSPTCEFSLFKKIGKIKDEEGKPILEDGKFSDEPIKFDGSIISVEIDRRLTTSSDEISIMLENNLGRYSPDYSNRKNYSNVKDLERSGYFQAIMPYNKIDVSMGYGDKVSELFSGQIVDVDIEEQYPTITIKAKNDLRKLLKPIDPMFSRELKYVNKTALHIILDLCKKAGVERVVMDSDEIDGYDYSIDKAVFELGTFYKDAIDKLLDSMGHRIYADRFGAIRIERITEYSQKDMEHWIFDDYIDLTQGSYKLSSSVIRNRVIVQAKDGWKAYEDPVLLKLANNERIAAGIEVPWATSDEKKYEVANHFFMGMRRQMRRLTVAVVGNPSMDPGDLVRLKMLTSTANNRYMITGIKSNFSNAGYFDIVDLEIVAETKNVAEEAIGDYGKEEDLGAVARYDIRDQIVDEARRWLGTYYQWGGDKVHNKNHYGFDCSHFTYVVLQKFGLMDHYRVARDQQRWSISIPRERLEKGDLVFYTNKSGKVNHVGIYIGDDKVISASGGNSSTNTIGKARQKNAKVKVHNIHYRPGPFFYGKAPKI